MEIYPSIASANCLEYGNEIQRINDWGNLHIDIEDGNFTPHITFGIKTVKAMISVTKATHIQVHLMVSQPEEYLKELKEYRVIEVFAHIEALNDPKAFIDSCHALGLETGIAIKAETGLSRLEPIYQWLDKILFLTSVPKDGTEEFYLPAFERAINAVRTIPDHIRLIADGDLSFSNVKSLSEAGFEGVVLGRRVFTNPNPFGLLQELSLQLSLQGGPSQ